MANYTTTDRDQRHRRVLAAHFRQETRLALDLPEPPPLANAVDPGALRLRARLQNLEYRVGGAGRAAVTHRHGDDAVEPAVIVGAGLEEHRGAEIIFPRRAAPRRATARQRTSRRPELRSGAGRTGWRRSVAADRSRYRYRTGGATSVRPWLFPLGRRSGAATRLDAAFAAT